MGRICGLGVVIGVICGIVILSGIIVIFSGIIDVPIIITIIAILTTIIVIITTIIVILNTTIQHTLQITNISVILQHSLHTHTTATRNVQKRSDLRQLQHALSHHRRHDRLDSRGRLHENAEEGQEETEVRNGGRFAQEETEKTNETLEEDEVVAADGGTKKTHKEKLDIVEGQWFAHSSEFFQDLHVIDHHGHHLRGRICVLAESQEPERSNYREAEARRGRMRWNDIITIARSMGVEPRKQRGEGDGLIGSEVVVVEAGRRTGFSRLDERGSTSREEKTNTMSSARPSS